jgi:3-oxoacyl-[acyl-carrier protein] reductase
MLVESFRAVGASGAPEDVADVILFVASYQTRWVTGENIQAGGGIVMV